MGCEYLVNNNLSQEIHDAVRIFVDRSLRRKAFLFSEVHVELRCCDLRCFICLCQRCLHLDPQAPEPLTTAHKRRTKPCPLASRFILYPVVYLHSKSCSIALFCPASDVARVRTDDILLSREQQQQRAVFLRPSAIRVTTSSRASSSRA